VQESRNNATSPQIRFPKLIEAWFESSETSRSACLQSLIMSSGEGTDDVLMLFLNSVRDCCDHVMDKLVKFRERLLNFGNDYLDDSMVYKELKIEQSFYVEEVGTFLDGLCLAIDYEKLIIMDTHRRLPQVSLPYDPLDLVDTTIEINALDFPDQINYLESLMTELSVEAAWLKRDSEAIESPTYRSLGSRRSSSFGLEVSGENVDMEEIDTFTEMVASTLRNILLEIESIEGNPVLLKEEGDGNVMELQESTVNVVDWVDKVEAND